MYHKISEPLNVLGSVLKNGAVSKDQLKKMVDKIKNAPPALLKDIGNAVSRGKATSDVEAGLLGKYGPIVALIIGLATAAHADPNAVGKSLAQADTSTKVEQILDSLINKVDLPVLTMKGDVDVSKINQALNDKVFLHFDTRVGPTQGKSA